MLSNRNYEIIIQDPQLNAITIAPPFSVKFSIKRNTLASLNSMGLELINLSRQTRGRIYKDRHTIAENWQIRVRAGYSRLVTVFQGNILEASSTRQGTEWITKIEALDGLFGAQNGFISQSVEGGTAKANIIQQVVSSMPGLVRGALGAPAEGESARGKVLFGNSADVLSEETDGQYFIDNEELFVLGDDEADFTRVALIDQRQLLQTPQRKDAILDVSLLFYPDVRIGQICQLRSIEAIYNGTYKIIGIQHDVEISSASCGVAKTVLSLYLGAKGLTAV